MIRIVRLHDLPAGMEELRAEATADGIRNMGLLVSQWLDGTQRYDKPGEAMFGAFEGERLAGIGCVKIETGAAEPAMRMRRLYVARGARGKGVGRALAVAMIARGFERTALLTCNAVPPGAAEFWDAMGFSRVAAGGWTHEKRR